MKAMAREFTTKEGRKVELVGATTKLLVIIDGKIVYKNISGLHFARRLALNYSKGHALADIDHAIKDNNAN